MDNRENSSILFNSPSFLLSVISNIESIIKRELSDAEDDLVIKCIKTIPLEMYQYNTPNEIMNILSNTVLSELQFSHCQVNNIDTHEMLKQNLDFKGDYEKKIIKDVSHNVEVNIESFLGTNDVSSLVKKINEPISSINTTYLILDTRYRILSNDGREYFKWGHINSIIVAQGTCNSVGNIRDIISVKLMPFRIPSVDSANTPYGRISVLVHELSSQSFIAHEERRYHFLGYIDRKNSLPRWLEIDPSNVCGGEYKFNKPITHLDGITLSLASPLEPVIFDHDRMDGIITSYANPTVVEFQKDHKLDNVSTVYITQYKSVNPKSDANVLLDINNKTGLIATVISPTEITLPVDTSSLKFTITGTVSPIISSQTLNGVGTLFTSELHPGDQIIIISGGTNPAFIVKSIQSDTELTLQTKYNGSGGVGLSVEKKNISSDYINVYFGSKRIFFTVELTYLSS